MTDLGNDPDGDLDGYDGPTNCTCGPWAQGGRDINCPTHAVQNRQVLGHSHREDVGSLPIARNANVDRLLEKFRALARSRREIA